MGEEEYEIVRANMLPPATSVSDNDMLLVVQGGRLKRVPPSLMKGTKGDQGLSSYLSVSAAFIQWKLGINGAWQNLIEIEKLRGPKGEKPLFRKVGGTLQMKYEGEPDSAYKNIFDREELKMKFSDLTAEEVDLLRLHFSDLSEAEIKELQKPAQDAADELNKVKTAFEEFSKTTVLAESNRVKAEEQRVEIEKLRVKAETARASAESLREDAEELRDQTETERINAEAARKEAESNRVLIEGLRVDEETKRAAAELIRIQSEQGRVTEEGKRVEVEKARVAAETLRDQSEKERDKAEGLRDQAESARASEEADRDTAEQDRITEETKRDKAEQERIAKEVKRVETEGARIVEEQLRKNAEKARKEAEASRVTAEELREQNTVQAILDTEEATDNANVAAKRANVAAAGAENIVKGFQSDWNVTDPADPNYIQNKPEIPTLDAVPTGETLSYVNSTGTTVSFCIGDEVRVLEDGEYVFYRLYDLVDGAASWQESGSGAALPGNIYLQGANYYNKSIIRIKEGYINE